MSKNYELDFFNQLNDLNILPPSFVLRVSDHIPEIINFIEKIVEYGHGYVAPDGMQVLLFSYDILWYKYFFIVQIYYK